ncbi:MAG: thiol peroxidase [Cyclobacteriaceae bacterium]
MAQITLKGNPINTSGDLPANGAGASNFTLTKTDLSEGSLSDYKGKKVILNIFPSIDTGTCAMSVRQFNEKAAGLENTVILCVSADLPFAQARFCGAEGIENVEMLSTFRSESFSTDYGVKIVDGPLAGLNARSIVVVDEAGSVKYTELVAETVDEPNYDAALAAL